MMSDGQGMATRKRISDVEPNERIVEGLLVKKLELREKWLVQVLQSRDRVSLASLEEAIIRMAEQTDIEFFKPGGTVDLSRNGMKKAIDEIINLGRQGKMLENIARTQSIMPSVGADNNLLIMDELKRISPKALHIFQLLGVHMQLSILVLEPPAEND